MKKLFATLFILLLTCDCALAYGGGNGYNFGSNAAWLPNNHARYSQRVREVRRYNTITRAIANRNNYNFNHQYDINSNANTATTRSIVAASSYQESRFSRNTKINTPTTSYTKNGITFYN